MIEAVSQFDPKTAAGILSRLALKLDVPEPSREAIGRLEDLERRVLTELRQTLRIAQNDNSRSAMEQLANALDQQAAQAAGIEPDESTAENMNRAAFYHQMRLRLGSSPTLPRVMKRIGRTVRNRWPKQRFDILIASRILAPLLLAIQKRYPYSGASSPTKNIKHAVFGCLLGG